MRFDYLQTPAVQVDDFDTAEVRATFFVYYSFANLKSLPYLRFYDPADSERDFNTQLERFRNDNHLPENAVIEIKEVVFSTVRHLPPNTI
jgi:hypothetical protein